MVSKVQTIPNVLKPILLLMKNYLLFNFSLYTNLLRMKRSIDTVCPLNPSQDVSQNPGIIDLVSTASCRGYGDNDRGGLKG